MNTGEKKDREGWEVWEKDALKMELNWKIIKKNYNVSIRSYRFWSFFLKNFWNNQRKIQIRVFNECFKKVENEKGGFLSFLEWRFFADIGSNWVFMR